MKKSSVLSLFLSLLLILACFSLCNLSAVYAAPQTGSAAAELKVTLETENFTAVASMTDGKYETFAVGSGGAVVTVTAPEDIGFLYVKFNSAPGIWVLSSANGAEAAAPAGSSACGQGGFLHEYADVAGTLGNTKKVEMHFDGKVEITELQVFGKGGIPSSVQRWEPVCDRADLLLLSAHADDDQLYFAGLLPYYATVREVNVQVVYYTEHLNENYRWHERLDALWTVGVTHYPVVSNFPDQLSYTKNNAYANFKAHGFSEETIVGWVAEQLRRFRPLAAVTHSFTGEYGHGQHMAAVDSLIRGAEKAADPSFVTQGYESYDLPKLYVHNYGSNVVRLDSIDLAFEKLGGKTPFQVSQEGFRQHESQWYNDFLTWMYGTIHPFSKPASVTVTKAAQITEYSPLTYGLYRKGAGVPDDVRKNDLLENLIDSPEPPAIVTTEPKAPETSVPTSVSTAAPQTSTTVPVSTAAPETSTTAPETSSAVPESTTAAGTTAPETSGTAAPVTTDSDATTGEETSSPEPQSSSAFPALSHPGTHGILTVWLSAILGGILLAIILWFGIPKIRHCNNR